MNAFSDCTRLNSITLPNDVKNFPADVFNNCEDLCYFYLDDEFSPMAWGANTPLKCNELAKHLIVNNIEVKELTIPDMFTSIPAYAYYTTSINKITLPDNIVINTNAFGKCMSLAYVYANSIASFSTWGANTPMTANDSPKHVYANGEEITSLEVSGDMVIGESAFRTACLNELNLTSSSATISAQAFALCRDLKEVKCSLETPPTLLNANAFTSPTTVIVPADLFEIYTTADGWKDLAVTKQIVPYNEYNTRTIDVVAEDQMSGIHKCIGDQNLDKVINLTVRGTINSYDIMVIREKMPSLKMLGLSEATIVANSYEYYPGYCTKDNELGGYFFYGLGYLTTIVLPQNITSINKYAFAQSGINELIIPESVKTVGDYAVYKCPNLKSVSFEGEVTLGQYAFNSCSQLSKVSFEDGNVSIGNSCFSSCSQLSKVSFGDGDVSIGNSCFSSCSQLSKVSFEDGIVEIGERGFESCSRLSSIDWHNASCCNIGRYAFVECTSLQSMSISCVDCNLGDRSLPNIKSLKLKGTLGDVYQFGGTKPAFTELDMSEVLYMKKIAQSNIFSNLTLQKLILPPMLDGVAFARTFADCQIDTLVISEGYVTIRQDFFAPPSPGKSTVNVLHIPASLETIDSYAFGDYITDPNTNTRYYSPVLFSKIDFAPNSKLTTIGTSAFRESKLTSFTLPASVKTIGSAAFSGNRSLSNFIIPSNSELTTISASAFTGCSNLKSFTIPSKVTTIGSGVFSGCNSLQSMVIAPGVKTIPASMMSGCTGLESVSMPSTVKTIGDKAFYGCTNLKTFKVPSSVESIGDQAFSGCTLLNDVYSYTLEPTSIAETTFSTWNTASLHVPYQAFYTYWYTRPWNKFLHLDSFLEDFDYFYANNDITLDSETGTLGGAPEAQLNAGGGLILRDEIGQKLADIHIRHDGSLSASLVYDASLEMIEGARLYMEIDVKANQWYFLCFPYDALLSEVVAPGKYAIRYYDGQERAQSGTGNSWKKLPEDDPYLHAGVGYIFQANAAGTLVVPVSAPDFTNVTRAQDLNTYASAVTANASWNFTGNITPSYYEIGDMQYKAPITIWDGKTYVAYRPEDDVYLLSPFQAFFVQRPVDASSLTFADECRMTYLESQEAKEAKLALRRAAARPLDRLLFNLVLSLDSLSDRTRVVYNDQASVGYDMDLDAAKFLSMDNDMPQFYSLDVQGEYCAINERPTADGIVLLGYFAPKAGTYTISAERLDAFCKLHDNLTGKDIDLELGDYTFQSEAGTFNSRLELRCTASVNGIARIYEETGVSLQGGKGQLVVKGVADQPVRIFSLNGEEVTTCSHDGVVSLPQGVYVATIGKVSTKVMIK